MALPLIDKSNQINFFSTHLTLDHIAVAVTDIEQSISFYEALGLKFNEHREEIVEQKVLTAFAPLVGTIGNDQLLPNAVLQNSVIQNSVMPNLELLQTTDMQGPIGKFIQKNGPGLHHLCFMVTDLVAKQKELEAKGYQFLYAQPKLGAHQKMINFIHPKSTGGVLIELSQHQTQE